MLIFLLTEDESIWKGFQVTCEMSSTTPEGSTFKDAFAGQRNDLWATQGALAVSCVNSSQYFRPPPLRVLLAEKVNGDASRLQTPFWL